MLFDFSWTLTRQKTRLFYCFQALTKLNGYFFEAFSKLDLKYLPSIVITSPSVMWAYNLTQDSLKLTRSW